MVFSVVHCYFPKQIRMSHLHYPHDSSESFGGSGGYGIDDEVFGGHEDWRFETEMCLEVVDGEVACMEEGSGSALCCSWKVVVASLKWMDWERGEVMSWTLNSWLRRQ